MAKYAPRVANLNRDKLKVFLGGLRSNITNNVMMGHSLPKFLSKALGRALKLETIG